MQKATNASARRPSASPLGQHAGRARRCGDQHVLDPLLGPHRPQQGAGLHLGPASSRRGFGGLARSGRRPWVGRRLAHSGRVGVRGRDLGVFGHKLSQARERALWRAFLTATVLRILVSQALRTAPRVVALALATAALVARAAPAPAAPLPALTPRGPVGWDHPAPAGRAAAASPRRGHAPSVLLRPRGLQRRRLPRHPLLRPSERRRGVRDRRAPRPGRDRLDLVHARPRRGRAHRPVRGSRSTGAGWSTPPCRRWSTGVWAPRSAFRWWPTATAARAASTSRCRCRFAPR